MATSDILANVRITMVVPIPPQKRPISRCEWDGRSFHFKKSVLQKKIVNNRPPPRIVVAVSSPMTKGRVQFTYIL